MTPATIAVVSDVICPWCYIGKRRLEGALGELGLSPAIQWLPYELNPGMPREGMDRAAYRAQKFGAAKSAQFDAQLSALGKEEGIAFAFERIERTPNTRRAHMLTTYAASAGKADAVVEALFRAYFEEGRDVGAEEVLGDIAQEVGLDRVAALAAWRDEGLSAHVADLERQAQNLGISGVPFFIVDAAWAMSGAQPKAEWIAAIRERGAAAGVDNTARGLAEPLIAGP